MSCGDCVSGERVERQGEIPDRNVGIPIFHALTSSINNNFEVASSGSLLGGIRLGQIRFESKVAPPESCPFG
ncbi:unnamed protein product [Ilex paraguariensis]|uniref:Uncharacterized protein n=1 Tax=Ilex paraguariensis TaxID=185542 RepID=A0ABC8UIG0_9AQUA